MDGAMAAPTECNQVRLSIIALLAAPGEVMDLEIGSGAAPLATPTITPQYLLGQLLVSTAVESLPRTLG